MASCHFVYAAVFRQSSAFGGINLVSQKVSFNKTHKNFGFKLDTESTLESWEPLFITEITRQDEPGVILWDRVSVDFEPIFSIPNKYFANKTAHAITFLTNLTEGNNEPFATFPYFFRANANGKLQGCRIYIGVLINLSYRNY